MMAVVDDNDTLPETDEFNNKSEIPLACATAPAGRGLFGAYYSNPDFHGRYDAGGPENQIQLIHLLAGPFAGVGHLFGAMDDPSSRRDTARRTRFTPRPTTGGGGGSMGN
ncbi:MAG: hypothetical protein IPP09_10760 [Elusimicrobia bacterium]|nr:hypothetical protein [Elusimicrobiota bacterium]